MIGNHLVQLHWVHSPTYLFTEIFCLIKLAYGFVKVGFHVSAIIRRTLSWCFVEIIEQRNSIYHLHIRCSREIWIYLHHKKPENLLVFNTSYLDVKSIQILVMMELNSEQSRAWNWHFSNRFYNLICVLTIKPFFYKFRMPGTCMEHSPTLWASILNINL